MSPASGAQDLMENVIPPIGKQRTVYTRETTTRDVYVIALVKARLTVLLNQNQNLNQRPSLSLHLSLNLRPILNLNLHLILM